MRMHKILQATMSEDSDDSEDSGPPFVMDPYKFQAPDAATLSRVYGGLPYRLDESQLLTIWKDGVWHPCGECFNCDGLGPAGFHCKRCEPTGFLYVGVAMCLDDIVMDPQKIGMMALLTHGTIEDFPDPRSAHSHLIMLLESYHADAHPDHDV